uniref:Transmembrane protein 184C n=1 Tax=Macrostomum lignano TaxID=282301 RepID=A0A1I8IFW2_9PLAT
MCLPQWRRWIRPLVFTLYIGLVLTALPLCVIELNKKGSPASVKAWFIAGLFVMVTLPVSLWAILAHLINYTNPGLQRYIIRILWMVPIYSLNAWFALRFPKQSIYLDTMRECYEAYVIHNFMMYLLCYLRSSYPDLEFMLEQRDPVKHLFPICCMPPWPMGRICELLGVYGEGDFLRFDSAFPYILFVNNMSQVDFVEHINHVSNSVRSTLPSRRSGASGGGDGASPRRSERRPLLEAAGEDFEPAGGASSGASSAEAGMLAAVPIDPCVEAAEADFDAEACSDAGTHRGGKWVVNA